MAGVSSFTIADILVMLCRWATANPHEKIAIVLKKIGIGDLAKGID